MENKEMPIISKVMAEEQQKDKNNVTSNRYQAHMQIISSSAITPSSPVPIGQTISSAGQVKMESHQQDNEMHVTSIDSGKAVHTVWEDATPGNEDIFYKRAGADFDPTTINLSNSAGGSSGSAVAVSGNDVHVIWSDNTPGNFDIFYRGSIDGGATFSPTINLSDNAAGSFGPAIAVSGNNVHVVWFDDTPGNRDILYRRSTDGGAQLYGPYKES